MKAIYINLDPMLAAFAAWIKGGKVGPAPTFNPLPLAVTIPLGESACIALPFDADGAEECWTSATVDGVEMCFMVGRQDGRTAGIGDNIATGQALGLSTLAPSAKYDMAAIQPGATAASFIVQFADEDLSLIGEDTPFTVLVRRETASGPVDLVDFTPPASAIAAGTDLKGCKFDGNEIVAAKTTGALSAPAGA